ncbi:hypothetical protein MC885_008174 [Smutsia gigantea]|nr:hypothetical protein MC885_008174 [Smutsia gigantea]
MKYTFGFPMAYYNQAAALVHLYLDGSVLVTHGRCEMGQGLHTKMIQVASRELNIPQSYIHLSETSTVTVPNIVITAGSIGKAFEKSISLSATGYFKGYHTHMDWEKEEGDAYPCFVYGAACSEVEIDCLTGAHKLLRTDIFLDSAFSTDPALDIGQVEGAFLQGMGLYTIEELKYSPEGVLYSQSPDDYKIPTVTEIPEEFHGLGEAGVFLGSSVLFAIYDAVTAARRQRGLAQNLRLSSAATPKLIRMTCVDQITGMIPRDDPSTLTPWSIHVS